MLIISKTFSVNMETVSVHMDKSHGKRQKRSLPLLFKTRDSACAINDCHNDKKKVCVEYKYAPWINPVQKRRGVYAPDLTS